MVGTYWKTAPPVAHAVKGPFVSTFPSGLVMVTMMPSHWLARMVASGWTLSSVQVTRVGWLTPTGFGAALTCMKAVHSVLAAFAGCVLAMAKNAADVNNSAINIAAKFLFFRVFTF